MIKEKYKLTGKIQTKDVLVGKLSNTTIKLPPVTQEKEVFPTKQVQEIIPDKNYTGFSKIIINKIPDEYVIPSGEIEIISNGNYDVSEKAGVKVNILEKQLGTKIITKNGTYNAIDDELDGYSSVNVETSGVDINDYFENTITNSNKNYFYSYCYVKKGTSVKVSPEVTTLNNAFSSSPNLVGLKIEVAKGQLRTIRNIFSQSKMETVPLFDTSLVTDFAYLVSNASNLLEFPNYDYSSAVDLSNIATSCGKITNIPDLNCPNNRSLNYSFTYCSKLNTIGFIACDAVTNISSVLMGCSSLENLGGFINLGKAYLTTSPANYSSYTLQLSNSNKLTHDSLMNVINNLYDIASKGVKPQQLILGTTNLAKLTSDEIAIAQSKGWTVS